MFTDPCSVIGIIAIPGMMTGAILGGSSVVQAARLQMIIMFMICSSVALAVMLTTILALGVVVDGEERVRVDRIDARPHAIWRARDMLLAYIVRAIKSGLGKVKETLLKLSGRKYGGTREKTRGDDEDGVLLGLMSDSR